MGDYYKIKKILIICSIILIILKIFKNFNYAVTFVDPKTSNNGVLYQTDNAFDTLSNITINAQFKYIAMFRAHLDNPNYRDQVISTLQRIYGYMISTNPTKAIYFQDYVGSGTDNFFVMRIINLSFDSYTTSIGEYQYNEHYCIADAVLINQTRSTELPTLVVNNKGIITQNVTSGTNTAVVGMLGIYNQLWLDLFEEAGLITSSPDYTNLLNTINNNILNLNQDIRNMYQALLTTNQTVGNTYNFLNNTTHTDETNLPISNITTDDQYSFNGVIDELESVLLSDNATDKTFNMELPNHDAFSFKVSPNLLSDTLTRVGGGGIILLIQALWYIGIYGIIIFDFKRMINQVASGDLLNITTDSSPVDNVVSASLSSSGAISTGTTHSGGDR